MFRWKITSFVVFSSLFWFVSMLSASLTWLALTWVLGATPKNGIKDEPRDLIKNESEDDVSSDESVKKEESESRLLHSYPAEGEAMGSGLERAEARGVQKRRSHTQADYQMML
jgi:seipin